MRGLRENLIISFSVALSRETFVNLLMNQNFRRAFAVRNKNMTVKTVAGSEGGKKKPGRGFPGKFQFKMSSVREVMKRKNQMSQLVKKRLLLSMEKEESRIEGEFHMKKLEEDLKKLKKEIQTLVKQAKKESGEIPVVRVRLQVSFPKKSNPVLLREKDVKAEKLMKLGIPGAGALERAVTQIQSQIDEVRKSQSVMLGEAGKLMNTLKMLEM